MTATSRFSVRERSRSALDISLRRGRNSALRLSYQWHRLQPTVDFPYCPTCVRIVRLLSSRRYPMARKAGQLISRGTRTGLVRVSLGRDPETGTRKYHNRTVHGSFREVRISLQRERNTRLTVLLALLASAKPDKPINIRSTL